MNSEIPAQPAPAASRRPRRWFFRLCWLALCGVTLLALATLLENWRGARAWRDAVAELQAAGEPTELAQIIPPPAADAENFAAIPLFHPLFDFEPIPAGHSLFTSARLRDPKAKERIDALKLPTVKDAGYYSYSQFVDLTAWQRALEAKDGRRTPAAAVLEALRQFEPELEALREAAKRPRARFPIRYQDSVAAMYPHVDFFRNFPRIVALRSVAKLAEGDVEGAHADLLLGLALEESLREDPLLLSGLMRAVMFDSALPPLWEGLARGQWNEAQLASVDAALQRRDYLASFQMAMRSERLIFTAPAMDALKKDPSLIGIATNADWWGGAVWWLIPSGWLDSAKAALSRSYCQLTLAADPKAHRFFPQRLQAVERAYETEYEEGEGYWFDPGRTLVQMALSGRVRTGLRFACSQASVDLARTAIALERYRLVHGALPESLSALPGVPSDVIGGAPLRYRLEPDGSFALYSIGWNERDDGGVAASIITGKILEEQKEGDWVWPPYPRPAAVK